MKMAVSLDKPGSCRHGRKARFRDPHPLRVHVTNDPQPLQAQIRVAQLELLIAHLPGIIGGTVVTALVMTGVVTLYIDSSWPWLWLAALLGLSLLRWFDRRRLLGLRLTTANVDAQLRRVTVLSALNATLWGLLGYLAVTPEATIGSLAVIMVLVGLVASANGFISHLRPMYTLYVFPMLLPVAVRFLTMDATSYRTIGALVILYAAVSFVTSRATAAAVLGGIRLRFQNLDLVDDLREEKRRSDEARERAEQASAAKSVFLSAASHDLRQPLHSLRLFTATLSARLAGAPDVDARRLVHKIDESGRALEGLLDAILDISRLDAGTLRARVSVVDLADTLARCAAAHAPIAESRGLRFEHDEPEAGQLWVETDPALLEQLLGNLLSNAVRYTRAGSVELRIVPEEQFIRIEVVDTGVGIAERDRARVFDEFVQLGNPERDRSQGIGLGLSIVRRIAQLLDLQLSFESQPGQGTRFALSVPRGDPSLRDVAADAADDDTPRSLEHGLDGRLILIVDDEASVRDALEGLIDTWGAVTLSAGSARDALELLEEIDTVPDAIVSDWRLRDGATGADAVAAVCNRVGRQIPALILTGDVAPERLRQIAATGWPVLHKPCDPTDLRRLLCAVVGGADD